MKTKIGNFEFANNKQLVEYIIPDGVTEIGRRAFWGCTSLKTVTIPRRCRYYNNAFCNTTKVIVR